MPEIGASIEMYVATRMPASNPVMRASRINRLSGDCYAFALLASGHADVVVDNTVKPHDFAALVPVVEGAGGKITDWEGKPLVMTRNARLLATGDDAAHRAAIKLLEI